MSDDKKVKKVGMKDIQRDGWEYELTISLNLDRDTHTAFASKDRTNLFENKDPFLITVETGKKIIEWCNSGDAVKDEVNDAIKLLTACQTLEDLKNTYTLLSSDLQGNQLIKDKTNELKPNLK